ncbi:MAG: hypothetical protein WDM88_09710 [Galbitalea sp.]
MGGLDEFQPSESDFARVENELFSRIDRRHRRRVLRHRLVAAAVALGLAGAGVAAGTIANQTQQSRFAYCYAADSVSSRSIQSVIPTLTISQSTTTGVRPSATRIALAVRICHGAWTVGVFSAGAGKKIPALQPCLRDDLVIAVFPRRNEGLSAAAFCDELGLTAP